MNWLRAPSLAGFASRALAIMLVVAWTIVPGFCGGLFEPDHGHEHHADHHDPIHSHGQLGAHGDDDDPCCKSLGDVKFLTSAADADAPVKVAFVDVVQAMTQVAIEVGREASPVASATGPPRWRDIRVLFYSPLAPPFSA